MHELDTILLSLEHTSNVPFQFFNPTVLLRTYKNFLKKCRKMVYAIRKITIPNKNKKGRAFISPFSNMHFRSFAYYPSSQCMK